MGFAVIHIEKGTSGKASGLGSHIERTKNVLNADAALTYQNFFIQDVSPDGKNISGQKPTVPLQERIDARIKSGYKGKTAIRKDAVTHLNVVMTGSHEEMMRLKDDRHIYSWAAENFLWASQKYGKENIVEFAVHMDERTPHIHMVVVPLTEDGRLSAKKVMGDKVKMSQLQTEYAKAMEVFNLERGIKGSTATHDSVKEFYGRVNQSIEKVPEVKVSDNVQISIPKIENPPVFGREKWVEAQNATLRDRIISGIEKGLKTAQNNLKQQMEHVTLTCVKLQEQVLRLRKENSQLKGIIKEQDKQLHPEKYEKKQTRTHSKGFHM